MQLYTLDYVIVGSCLVLVIAMVGLYYMWRSGKMCFRSKNSCTTFADNTRAVADAEEGRTPLLTPEKSVNATATSTSNAAETRRFKNPVASKPHKYKLGKKLGDGAYGTVHLAIRREDLANVAVKMIPCEASGAEQAMKEYDLCANLQGHENIIKLFDVFFDEQDPATARQMKNVGATVSTSAVLKKLNVRVVAAPTVKFLCIVSQYCQEGTLFDLIIAEKANRRVGSSRSIHQLISEKRVWMYLLQLLNALAFLHSKNVMHRDLKPSNVLLMDSYNRIVLTDFGLSRIVEDKEYAETRTGTLQYMSPEQVQRHYSFKSDVWGAGCLLYGMCTGRVTASDCRVMFRDQMKPTFEREIRMDLCGYSEELKQMLFTLLTRNVGDRPTAAEAAALCLRERPFGEQ